MVSPLWDSHHQRALADEVAQVGELRAGGERDAAADNPREEVLRRQRRVAGGAAAHEEDVVGIAQPGRETARVLAPAVGEAP
jgi:hypothetical protein